MTEAQRLAATLFEEADYDIHHEAKSCMRESAAELRRLDAVNVQMLEALKSLVGWFDSYSKESAERNIKKARAAIKTAIGETK